MPVDKILRGLKRFRKHVYPKHRELFHKLALGQRPDALFITCADSRIDPCLLTQTKPGELFICRVIGNIVPPYPKTIGGVSATIEYAVGVLGVPEVIVCGHTDCGVMKGVLNPDALESFSSVSMWLHHAEAARQDAEEAALQPPVQPPTTEYLLSVAEFNVVEQLKNLRTHPTVAARLRQGNLRLSGWVYHIGRGVVTVYNPNRKKFSPVRFSKAKRKKRQRRGLRLKVSPVDTSGSVG